MKKNKVIFILYSLAVGGAERRAASIANYLVDHGFELEILLLDSPYIKFELDERIKVVYLCNGLENNVAEIPDRVEVFHSKINSVSLIKQAKLRLNKSFNYLQYQASEQLEYLKRRYSKKIYDYIINKSDYTVVSWMSYANVSTCYALKQLNNEIVLVECTSPETEFPKGHHMNQLKERYYSNAKKIICQTPDEADFYDYLTETKKLVIPNPIFGNYPDRYEGTRRKAIVNFCRLEKQKNIPLLIDSFMLLHKDFPEYKLHIYGEGYEKNNLVRYAKEIGMSDSVEFFDFDVNIHDKIRDYAMYVSSSDREGMSNSMLEAMAIGLPTISTDCPAGAARMLIDDYENGIVVPMRNPNAMYKAMKYIIDNPGEAEKMSINATKLREKLSMDRIGAMWLEALQE